MGKKIVQVCGTSGSGKTHLVRRIMAECKGKQPFFDGDRGRPMGYDMMLGKQPVRVLGSYENQQGGCDTIPTLDLTFNLVKQSWAEGRTVIFEGLLVSKNFGRGLEIFRMAGRSMVIVGLNTSLEQCYQSIYDRRVALGKPRGEKPGATERDKRAHDNYVQKMRQIDANVYRVDREKAFEAVMKELRS